MTFEVVVLPRIAYSGLGMVLKSRCSRIQMAWPASPVQSHGVKCIESLGGLQGLVCWHRVATQQVTEVSVAQVGNPVIASLPKPASLAPAGSRALV